MINCRPLRLAFKIGSVFAPLSRWRKKLRNRGASTKRFESGKVYDCFTFFNELDLLEIRLNILNEVVDYFVIVEGNKTHTGKSKDFVFESNSARFSTFKPKIIYIKVENFPSIAGLDQDEFGRNAAWILERMQRNAIDQGLQSAKANDVILVSDLDEIPRPECIVAHKDTTGVKIFAQRMYSCYLNLRNYTEPYWLNGTRMASLSELRKTNSSCVDMSWVPEGSLGKPQALRFASGRVVKDAGWHFTSLGGAEAIMKKMEALCHQELVSEDIRRLDEIKRRLAAGEDIFGRDVKYQFVEIDESYPQYLLKNQNRYKDLVFQVKGAFKYGIEYRRVKDRIEAPVPNSSWAFLCGAICENTDVLEFGPSHGYITKYLKEQKYCRVTIVECDEECATIASGFAEKTIVADVERPSEWVACLGDNRFDYVMFGDVLEHLRDPETALREAVRFLRPQGRLLVSLPNIAHNSVLIDLFNGKFNYRNIGIMDETHLRFFTLDSARRLIERVGLAIERVDKVLVPEKETFIRNSLSDLPFKMRRFVRERSDGQVYQFVFTAKFK